VFASPELDTIPLSHPFRERMGSVVVVGEVAARGIDLAGFPERPAVPDAGGEGEYALADACPDAVGDVSAVILEGELAPLAMSWTDSIH
jgi:hypothetical protein